MTLKVNFGRIHELRPFVEELSKLSLDPIELDHLVSKGFLGYKINSNYSGIAAVKAIKERVQVFGAYLFKESRPVIRRRLGEILGFSDDL